MGPPDEKLMTQIWQLLQGEKTQEVMKLIEAQSPAMVQLQSWVMTFLGGLFLLAIYTTTLCFWTHWCVLADSSWLKAWSISQKTLRKHWKPMLWLGMIWMAPTLLINLGILSGIAPIAVVAFFLSLLAKTFFTLLFCLFLIEQEPGLIKALPAPVAAK